MKLSFKLKDLEGPLDLLLHLIEKNKADILDIPISLITDQYMMYMEQIEEDRLENMSEFLVMAATLLDIKARLLLPPEKNEEGEEIDPRSELVQQLLQYKMYKYMSYDLQQREEGASRILYRREQLPEEVKHYRAPVDIGELLSDVTLASLNEIFLEVMKRRIEKEEVDTRTVLKQVTDRIRSRKRCTFRSLLSSGKSKMYTVVTFLLILELMKLGRVGVEQDAAFGEITITARDRSEWNEGASEGEGEDLLQLLETDG